ncbi:MAG: ATP cone domain-containing protein [Planctomycetota bacterium]
MIRVRKRDGTTELFSQAKLAGAMWRAMRDCGGEFQHCRNLALAIAIYLDRTGRRCVGSAALFEMTLKVLRRAEQGETAEQMEAAAEQRARGRRKLYVLDADGSRRPWRKGALACQIQEGWNVRRATARNLASRVEQSLLRREAEGVPAAELESIVNGLVSAHGLADAVPVRQTIAQ